MNTDSNDETTSKKGVNSIIELIYAELLKAGIKRADVEVEPTNADSPTLFILVFWGEVDYSVQLREAIQFHTCLRLPEVDSSLHAFVYVPDSWLPEASAAPVAPPPPISPPVYIPAWRTWGKLRQTVHFWLMRHGIEFEDGAVDCFPGNPNQGNIDRHFAIVINHRYFGVDVMIVPFSGVFDDELNTPHAEIAAHEKDGDQ